MAGNVIDVGLVKRKVNRYVYVNEMKDILSCMYKLESVPLQPLKDLFPNCIQDIIEDYFNVSLKFDETELLQKLFTKFLWQQNFYDINSELEIEHVLPVITYYVFKSGKIGINISGIENWNKKAMLFIFCITLDCYKNISFTYYNRSEGHVTHDFWREYIHTYLK